MKYEKCLQLQKSTSMLNENEQITCQWDVLGCHHSNSLERIPTLPVLRALTQSAYHSLVENKPRARDVTFFSKCFVLPTLNDKSPPPFFSSQSYQKLRAGAIWTLTLLKPSDGRSFVAAAADNVWLGWDEAVYRESQRGHR